MLTLAALSIPGGWELIVILVIVLILFGPKNLPKIGGAIGRSIREFKDGLSSLSGDDDKDEKDAGEKKSVQPMKRERTEALPGSDEKSTAAQAASAPSEPVNKND